MMRIEITYLGKPVENVDKKIDKALKNVGFVWTGQGYDLVNGVRDIFYEINSEEDDE